LSKAKNRSGSKRRKSSKLARLPVGRTSASNRDRELKLSEIIKEMASTTLRNPDAIPSEPAAIAGLMLACAGWNSAVGDSTALDQLLKQLEHIDWSGVLPWAELRSEDSEKLVAELVNYKRERYPSDLRIIAATEMTPEGSLRVHWTEPKNVASADFRSAKSNVKGKRNVGNVKRGRPIADKLVKKMDGYVRGQVIDLNAVMAGKANAEALQETVATRDELAGLEPAHAIYVYAQNQLSVMCEQLTALDEMGRFVKLIGKAEDEYMPSGPPMSPLTTSFFTFWALFDACVGLAEETLATTCMAVGASFGMHEELLRVFGLLQESRMGVYADEGEDKDTILLRELVTDTVCRAVLPSGTRGRKGELWYVRVLPPPLPEIAEHVILTTPYLLLEPSEREWDAYFRRTLPDAPLQDRIARYEHHMKFGPTRNFWSEFVFEAYVSHRTDVIYLKGVPDVPESRPHSRANGG
jgi:hypothetical protein